jgi:ATP-dependent Clp protease ATP-binding subunit ClpC
VFDRFTNEVRRALVLASEETQRRNRPLIDIDSVLVALLRVPEGLAARALQATGVNLEMVRGASPQVSSNDDSPNRRPSHRTHGRL